MRAIGSQSLKYTNWTGSITILLDSKLRLKQPPQIPNDRTKPKDKDAHKVPFNLHASIIRNRDHGGIRSLGCRWGAVRQLRCARRRICY